ncbi:MAG TPA: DUF1330 domain-containing protein [Thermoanaerobaculia bacterium]|nr:DUF1330 domain-containing protein [Thermoanaerobaculia bacterium]
MAPKGYWIATYRSVSDPAALARYAEAGAPAIVAGGGRFLARGLPAKAYESALAQRCVVIEFESVAAAVATYEGPAYQAALALLAGAVEREVRIVEGLPAPPGRMSML